MLPEDIPLHLYHDDEHCLVVEKPGDMTVHPAKSVRSGTLVNALLCDPRLCPPTAHAAKPFLI